MRKLFQAASARACQGLGRPSILVALLFLGIACVTCAECLRIRAIRTTPLAPEPLLEVNAGLYPSQGDIRPDKLSQYACPAAFAEKRYDEIRIMVFQRCASVTSVWGIPLWRRIECSVGTTAIKGDDIQYSIPKSVWFAARDCIPELKSVSAEQLSQPSSAETRFDRTGISAVGLHLLGFALFVPALCVLAVKALRFRATRAAACLSYPAK
jgi:hypothetical protein